ALRREADACLFTDFAKLLAVVEEELRDSVIVCDEEILVAGATQVSDCCRQRPPARVDACLLTDFFKRSVTPVVEEILAPAILRVLKTLRHHLRVLQMPEINIFRIIATEKKIQSSIT